MSFVDKYKEFIAKQQNDLRYSSVNTIGEVEQIDEAFEKGSYVKHSNGKVGKVVNVSGDKSSVDVKWNATGKVSSHPADQLQKMSRTNEEVEQIDEANPNKRHTRDELKAAAQKHIKARDSLAKDVNASREKMDQSGGRLYRILKSAQKRAAEGDKAAVRTAMRGQEFSKTHAADIAAHNKVYGTWRKHDKAATVASKMSFGKPKSQGGVGGMYKEDVESYINRLIAEGYDDDTIISGILEHYELNEEAEQIDELSKETLHSYAKKAISSGDMAARMSNGGKNADMNKIANKRYKGIHAAVGKLAKEEIEEIDEARPQLPSDRIPGAPGSKMPRGYTSKGGETPSQLKKDIKKLKNEEAEQIDEVLDTLPKLASYVIRHNLSHKKALATGDTETARKREKGAEVFKRQFAKAQGRDLKKEEAEQIDEISKKLVKSYLNKAPSNQMTNIANLTAMHGYKDDESEKYEKNIDNRSKYIPLARAKRNINAKSDGTTAKVRATEEVEHIDEVLGKSASAGEWIKDFIKSKNPKFAGKSKEERKKQALAAYYAKKRED